jgi:acetyl esterase/lipase
VYPPPYHQLAGPCDIPAVRYRYGDGEDRWADLRVPHGTPPVPVAVLLHGGFWRLPWAADLMHALTGDLHRSGWATLNVEYRRVGARGGGWPATFVDVAAAIDLLADVAPSAGLDLGTVVAIGHSAGGHLALWLAARRTLPPGAPGARPMVLPTAVVALAAVSNLVDAAAGELGGGAAAELLGGPPAAVPGRYAATSPRERLPLRVPQLVVHGTRDDTVPVSMSEEYAAAAAAAGDDVELVTVAGGDHAELIDPTSRGWASVVAWLDRLAQHQATAGVDAGRVRPMPASEWSSVL